jgi:GNAT superfamily N-acetyltransferase
MYGVVMTDVAKNSSLPGVRIRQLAREDLVAISAAFDDLGWNKPVALYERYFLEQSAGDRVVFVAFVDSEFAGYVTVIWKSTYPPFADAGVSEINDFNVLPSFRRRGIGSALMDAAEATISERSDVAGIGVGMTADYGQAQRMYPKRGYVPDGRGLAQGGEVVKFRQPIVVDDSTALWFTKDLVR